MSRNYELLQQAQFGIGIARTFEKQENATAAEGLIGTPQGFSSLEPAVREEVLKLVERLFLAGEKLRPELSCLRQLKQTSSAIGSARSLHSYWQRAF